MVPGQSTEDLGQQSQAMRAGEDEESSRGSRRQPRQLPAAAGKAAGEECQLQAAVAACPRSSPRGLGEHSPAKPKGSRGTLSQFLKVREGKMRVRKGNAGLDAERRVMRYFPPKASVLLFMHVLSVV